MLDATTAREEGASKRRGGYRVEGVRFSEVREVVVAPSVELQRVDSFSFSTRFLGDSSARRVEKGARRAPWSLARPEELAAGALIQWYRSLLPRASLWAGCEELAKLGRKSTGHRAFNGLQGEHAKLHRDMNNA